MDDAEDALLTGDTLALIQAIRNIDNPIDFQYLIDIALNIQDFTSLWYVIEVASNLNFDDESEDLDTYLLSRCSRDGQTLPCEFLQNRDNSMIVLRNAIINGDDQALFYALDLLYGSLDPRDFPSYSTQDYERTLAQGRLLDTEIEKMLTQAKPSFLGRIFPNLPQRLKTNLTLRLNRI